MQAWLLVNHEEPRFIARKYHGRQMYPDELTYRNGMCGTRIPQKPAPNRHIVKKYTRCRVIVKEAPLEFPLESPITNKKWLQPIGCNSFDFIGAEK
jgi:hypothetical protein